MFQMRGKFDIASSGGGAPSGTSPNTGTPPLGRSKEIGPDPRVQKFVDG